MVNQWNIVTTKIIKIIKVMTETIVLLFSNFMSAQQVLITVSNLLTIANIYLLVY